MQVLRREMAACLGELQESKPVIRNLLTPAAVHSFRKTCYTAVLAKGRSRPAVTSLLIDERPRVLLVFESEWKRVRATE
jgi:hypothetical protein